MWVLNIGKNEFHWVSLFHCNDTIKYSVVHHNKVINSEHHQTGKYTYREVYSNVFCLGKYKKNISE